MSKVGFISAVALALAGSTVAFADIGSYVYRAKSVTIAAGQDVPPTQPTPDTDPDPIAPFPAVSDASAGATALSETRRLTGHDGILVSVSGDGAAFRLCETEACGSVPFGTTPTQAARDAWVQVAVTAGEEGSSRVATLAYGSRSADFSVSVPALDRDPDPIEPFAFVSNASAGTVVVSETRLLSGHDGIAVSVSGTDAEFRVCATSDCSGAEFRTTPANAPRDSWVQVRLVAGTADTLRTATLTYGGRVAQFHVSVPPLDRDPDPIAAFAPVENAAPGSLVTSPVRRLTGHDGIVVSVAGEGAVFRVCPTADCGGVAFGAAASEAARDDYVQLAVTAGDAPSSRTATLTYGERTASFRVSVPQAPGQPNEMAFAPVTDASRGGWIQSNRVQVVGNTVGAQVSIRGGASFRTCATQYCNEHTPTGGYAYTARSVAPGHWIQMRHDSGGVGTVVSTLTYGTRTTEWSVTTRTGTGPSMRLTLPSGAVFRIWGWSNAPKNLMALNLYPDTENYGFIAIHQNPWCQTSLRPGRDLVPVIGWSSGCGSTGKTAEQLWAEYTATPMPTKIELENPGSRVVSNIMYQPHQLTWTKL